MAASVLGTLLTSLPKAPSYIDIDPTQVQADTLAGNLENLPAAENLANQVNTFNTDQLLKQLEKMLPGYGSLRDLVTQTVTSRTRGELTPEEQRQLQQSAAERGVALGTRGSQFQQYDLLRNLGLSRNALVGQGLRESMAWEAGQPRVPLYDFGGSFLTAQQRLNFEFLQAQANKPIEWLKNQIKSMGSPAKRATIQFLDWLGTEGTSILNMYAGGAMGGGGMGGGGGSATPDMRGGNLSLDRASPEAQAWWSWNGQAPGG